MSPWDSLLKTPAPHEHYVQLYGADTQLLARNVSQYLYEGMKRGDGLLVIATAENITSFKGELGSLGVDPDAAVLRAQLLCLDAQETLDRFMVNGQPDWARFESTIEAAKRRLRPQLNHEGLRAYGEMVGILWTTGQRAAAIQLEEFWNKLLSRSAFNLFCGYPIDVFAPDSGIAGLDGILCAHTHLLPTGPNGDLESALDRSMEEILGPNAHDTRQLIKANYQPFWAVLPRAEAIIIWLRNNLPDRAEEVFARARQYYRQAGMGSVH